MNQSKLRAKTQSSQGWKKKRGKKKRGKKSVGKKQWEKSVEKKRGKACLQHKP